MNNNTSIVQIKVCTVCRTEKPATFEHFNKMKNGRYGVSGRCKSCDKTYREENKEKLKAKKKEYYENNKEVLNEKKKIIYENNKEYFRNYKAEYYKKNKETKIKEYKEKNREEILKKKKEHYQSTREQQLEYAKKYIALNKEKINERKKKYYRLNKDKCIKWTQKREALKRQLPATFTEEQWNKTKEFFNHRCAYCGKEKKLAQDHFIPLSNGGEYTINNIVPACKSCNSSKHNKNFFEWYPTCKHYSKQREEKILSYLGYNNKVQQLALL